MTVAQQDITCPIFNVKAEERITNVDSRHIISPRAGGEYIITGTASAVIDNWSEAIKIKLARWIYEQNKLGEPPVIKSDTDEVMVERKNLRVIERANALFEFIGEKCPKLNQPINWIYQGSFTEYFPYELLAATESIYKTLDLGEEIRSSSELEYLFGYLNEDGRLAMDNNKLYYITPYGHSYLEGSTAINSNQAFVAMWFGDDVKAAYEKAIEPAIVHAGYTPMRIDNKQTNNKIDDEIVAEIRKSKFVIADFTSGRAGKTLIARGGVYYEAGFAQGLGLPVIWTCREDCIQDVHFDTRQYNHIVWKKPEDLYKKLKNRIEATIT